KADNNTEHYEKALISIEKALKTLKPEVQDVVEAYLNAAEIHIQLEDAEQTLNCLNAAQNPAYSYNHGFDVIVKETQSIELTEYDLEEMAAADREKIAEQYSTDDLEELFERTEPDEDGNRDYFTELEDETEQTDTVYRLDESEKLTYPPEDTDHINRLYVGAYTLQKEFQKVIEYAKKLQTSEDLQNSYIGRYAEVNAMGELKSEDAPKKYEEVIRFFRNAMIKDPTDIMAVTFRIQCYIDIQDYDEAEKMCNLLIPEIREPMMEKINEAKAGGGKE
ncbi:MAG: tetratricopeptide repeat protein, partial [Lachnospiraceae bacterium]|nr:tetratricopeptide repeat protein [Lachnospiraceae bacterium]